ncbi:hypothetical protein CVT25_004608 [Psilocybe cyanescens]|uniref:F-box domain-containing protein n=1 Tax=Psilocybe cyanescens TaxID=93625 RepID=A0A409VS57_PSICY|nr:hypothetical protein CVT25_004608 [Psilocybe cyanescens]
MSRKHFQTGLTYYKEGEYQKALQQFTEALKHDGQNKYLILDSRSAVYMKLGDTKEALKDAKKTIEVAPDRWQGYARAARAFFDAKKLDASLTMVSLALDRLKEGETQRRASLYFLRSEVEAAKLETERRRRLFTDHMGKLPIELFSEIAKMVIQDNKTTPITLSHVSRHWRDVVHNLPQLWDNLILTRRRPMQKAKVWVERSKGKIKELSIRASAMEVPHWTGDSLETLAWDHLHVFKVQQWDAVAFLRYIGKLDALTNIEYFETDQPNSIPAFPFGKEEADTKLRHLTVISSSNNVITPLAVRSLATLTLHNVYAPSQNFVDVLKASPLLESITLQNVSFDFVPDQTLDLLYLKYLFLKALIPIAIYDVRFPALEVLRIESNHSAGVSQLLERLAATRPTHLTELALCSCLCSPEPVVALLRISTNLQRLEITNISRLASLAIEALAETYSPPANSSTDSATLQRASPICPKLAHVDFSRCPDVQTGPLVRLIKSHRSTDIERIVGGEERIPSPWSEILSLKIDECPQVDSAWLPWLRQRVPSVSCVYMKKNAKYRA